MVGAAEQAARLAAQAQTPLAAWVRAKLALRAGQLDAAVPRISSLKPTVLIVTGDHSTPAYLKSHSWHSVPTLLVSDCCRPDAETQFGECNCVRGGLGQFEAKYLMVLASFGTLTCYNAKEGGEPLWEEDFDDANFSSSPSLAGKHVFLFSEQGKAYLIEPTDEKCVRVAENELGEECVTSPAFQPGRIYIRGKEHLICIGAKAP